MNIKKGKKKLKNIQKEFKKDEEGRVVVEISIRDKDEVLSPFCYENKEIINEEFATLMDNITKSVPPREKIKLSVKCPNINNDEKIQFSNAIKNYYENKLVDNQLRMKKMYTIFIASIILSILSLGLLFLANYFNFHFIIKEVVDVLAWVFVWEATYIVVFQRGDLKLSKLRYLALYNSKIEIV